ncbi:MAG: VCBS repeat-containing protein [Candidatus Schekmanbacteria bacterium]|nr:VCBS repeat-containing protein [Candidatus Schekmanbacteria bacterium]
MAAPRSEDELVPAIHRRCRRSLAAILSCVILALCTAPAGRAAEPRAAYRHQTLTLPAAPSAVVATDLDGDGDRDLLIAVAYSEWGEISEDRFEELAFFTEVVPALFDRRALLAFLRQADGTYSQAAAPMELPLAVLTIAGGPRKAPALALTDDGLGRITLQQSPGGDGTLELRPLLADPPVLAGSETILTGLDLYRQTATDQGEVLLPARDGIAAYAVSGGELAVAAASRLRFASDEIRSGAAARRSYPLPMRADIDGDGVADLVVKHGAGKHEKTLLVALGRGHARYLEPRAVDLAAVMPVSGGGDSGASTRAATPSADGNSVDNEDDEERWQLCFVGDIDGKRGAEIALRRQQRTNRGELREAKEPRVQYRFHRVLADLTIERQPYSTLDAVGHGFEFSLADLSARMFRDLDGDGRKDLITVTLDFSLLQTLRVLATKRVSIDLAFHVYRQVESGGFAMVDGLSLEETVRIDLNDLNLGRLGNFAGDFDGDGKIDFVRLGKERRVAIHKGLAACRYPRRPDLRIDLIEPPGHVGLISIRDLNGDGRDDLTVIRPLRSADPALSDPVLLDLYVSGNAPS